MAESPRPTLASVTVFTEPDQGVRRGRGRPPHVGGYTNLEQDIVAAPSGVSETRT
jgi:hypothetical protein